jgi:protein-disulfide isomerase
MFLKSVGAALAALTLVACGPAGRPATAPVEGDAFMGPADAKVTVIEYGSPTCPGCKAWHDTFWEEVKRDYVDPGKVKFIFREFAIHGAIDAGIFAVARCAGPEDFFKVIDEAFAMQNDLVMGAQSGNAMPALQTLGAKFQFSGEQVKSCVNDKAIIQRINDVGAYARQVGVNSTPTFFVNGTQMADSNWTSVKAAVDAALSGQAIPTPITPPADAVPHEHVPGDQH